ncbi:Hypothetical protein SCLAV_0057 [Streptomyces clavuligerus]|uniref:Uncharacterized protein n=1 Tax=Streptomyces clavuligerus TaxID=1901 RepID=E2Q5X3_STRCL|nr:Hypothetical protein SCLAV_0057 [Streptomyces clavuligerus]
MSDDGTAACPRTAQTGVPSAGRTRTTGVLSLSRSAWRSRGRTPNR